MRNILIAQTMYATYRKGINPGPYFSQNKTLKNTFNDARTPAGTDLVKGLHRTNTSIPKLALRFEKIRTRQIVKKEIRPWLICGVSRTDNVLRRTRLSRLAELVPPTPPCHPQTPLARAGSRNACKPKIPHYRSKLFFFIIKASVRVPNLMGVGRGATPVS